MTISIKTCLRLCLGLAMAAGMSGNTVEMKLKSPNPSSELLEMDRFPPSDFFLESFFASTSCISSRKTTVFFGEKRIEAEEFSSADLVT